MAEPEKINLEIFAQDSRGKRESLGKYVTYMENYTLCVTIPRLTSLELSDMRFLHIEISRKDS